MASQLAIELTLEQAQGCIFTPPSTVTGFTSTAPAFTIPPPIAANGFVIGAPQTYTSSTTPTYGVGNVNLIPEIMQFDASYDEMFLQGLRDGGVYVLLLILVPSNSVHGIHSSFQLLRLLLSTYWCRKDQDQSRPCLLSRNVLLLVLHMTLELVSLTRLSKAVVGSLALYNSSNGELVEGIILSNIDISQPNQSNVV